MRIDPEIKLDFSDVLIQPKRSTLGSRAEISVSRTFPLKKWHHGMVWDCVPVIAANMDSVGVPSVANALAQHGIMTAMTKFTTESEWETVNDRNLAFKSFGLDVSPEAIAEQCQNSSKRTLICLDVANGYMQRFVTHVAKVRQLIPHAIIMAGNVVTGDMTTELVLAGADIVKVGIGSGSVCTTRIQTGVGYPQLSAIIECADAAHGQGGLVCSDGGCTSPGDVAKAFAAGADLVMLGGMFAGHTECQGDLKILPDGRKVKEFYGMSSADAQMNHYGGTSDYRAPEGKTVQVPYRGSIDTTAKAILGGVRSACTYVGARTLKDLSKCTTFVRVSRQANTVFGGGSN